MLCFGSCHAFLDFDIYQQNGAAVADNM